MEKILVCDGVKDLKKYLETHKNLKICLYLAEKTKEAWDISTSRVYMNQIDESFVYLPVNIKKGDWESIREVYNIAEKENQIVAINQLSCLSWASIPLSLSLSFSRLIASRSISNCLI